MKPAGTKNEDVFHAIARWLSHLRQQFGKWFASAGRISQTLRIKISAPFRIINEIPILRLAIVVPIAVSIWLFVERVTPSILKFLLQTELFVTVFLSHFIAILAAAYIAPRIYSRQTILVIAIIFISVRLIMGIAILSEETESNHLSLVVDVLSALAGLALGALWFLYRIRTTEKRKQAE